MSAWTRLVRFQDESGKIRLGQPVDASQDVGLACAAGEPVQVKLIEGDIYDGTVTEETATIKKVSAALAQRIASTVCLPCPRPSVFRSRFWSSRLCDMAAACTRHPRAVQPYPLPRPQLQG